MTVLLVGGSTAAHAVEPDDDMGAWFRIDTDGASTQFWLGATHDLGPIALASDIYVVGAFAELDVGPTFTFEDLTLTPMAGIGFDFAAKNATTLIAPQLFTIWKPGRVHFESWIQVFLGSVFDDEAADIAYTRNFLLYAVHDVLALGPHVEVSYDLDEGLTSLPIGGHANVVYGAKNTLELFLGYDPEAPADTHRLAGRFSFIRTW